MERKISHKVGVKILTETQLENVLPTYENFFHKVDVCREAAQRESEMNEKRHYQYNFMYDNVLSFLGKRGTGKTSVAFTLRKMIKEKYEKKHCDVVLPLIIPEVIPSNCTVLGWILAIVGEEITQLEDQITDLEKGEKNESCWSKCRYSEGMNGEEKLTIKLERLCQRFYAGSYDPSNESSYYKVIDYSVRQAVDYYNFGKGIAEIWDGWIDRIKYLYELKARKENETKKNEKATICPMIYFIFDDVDLAPEKIEELLSVIIKYLSHPNIMVLTTADESLFLEVIEKSLDKKIGRLPGEWRHYLMQNAQTPYAHWRHNLSEDNSEQEDLVYKTARMYLGKVLPTSTRYYLCMFNTAQQKENFCLEDGINLGIAVQNEIRLLINCCYRKRVNNFMLSNDKVVNFYLKFFGNTSRQIGNVYIALQELIETLKSISIRVQKGTLSEERALQKVYQNIRNFLSIAITANHDLAKVVEQIDGFVDEIYMWEYNQWRLYINYIYLNDFLKKKLSEESMQKKVQISMALYALLVFVENILLIVEYSFPNGITKRRTTHAVVYLTEYISTSVFSEQKLFRDDLHPDEFFAHYSNILDRLESIVDNKEKGARFHMEYLYSFREYSYKRPPKRDEVAKIFKSNPKWFGQLTAMLTMVYGNAYLITADDVEECMVSFDNIYLTGYQTRIDRILKSNIVNCFYPIKLQEMWLKVGAELQDAIEGTSSQNEYCYEMLEHIKGKLKRETQNLESNYIALSGVISIARSIVSKEGIGAKEYISILKMCSESAWYNMPSRKNLIRDVNGKKKLIRECIALISKEERGLGTQAILYDPILATDVLEELMKYNLGNSEQVMEVYDMLEAEIYTEESLNEKKKSASAVIISRFLYNELARLLSDCIIRLENWDNDDEYLVRDCRRTLDNLDIAIDFHKEENLTGAIFFTFRILFLELLQRAYLYQVVAERYESQNSMSSRELEYIRKPRNRESSTYYYNLFNTMVEMIEKPIHDIIRNESDIQESDTIIEENEEILIIKDSIIESYREERRRYATKLLRGNGNE